MAYSRRKRRKPTGYSSRRRRSSFNTRSRSRNTRGYSRGRSRYSGASRGNVLRIVLEQPTAPLGRPGLTWPGLVPGTPDTAGTAGTATPDPASGRARF